MSALDSLSTTSISKVSVASSQQNKWDLVLNVPDKLAEWDYGYVINGEVIGSTREHILELVKRGEEIRFVWTPEVPEPVFPDRVPFLIDGFRQLMLKEARKAILIGAALLGVAILLAAGLQDWNWMYRNIFFLFGGLAVSEGVWQLARSRHYDQEQALSDGSAVRFAAWLKKKRISGYTFTLAALMVIVGAVQVVTGGSIQVAGLVKPAVWDGEVWRLFTATLMHGNYLHFWMNFLALLHFSKIVEQTVQRPYVPLVFFVTGAIGSFFSVLLYPHTTSVGASGGLMGLLGFITIASYFDKARYPPKYFRQMIETIISVGLFGLIGFAFIDNAAHFGGLIGGLCMGWLLLKKNEQSNKKDDNLLKLAGVVALLVLASITAFAVYRMLR